MGLPLTSLAAAPGPGPLGTPLHTPRHVPLVSHLLQNFARTKSKNDHFICNKCSLIMRLIFLHLYQIGVALNSALKTMYVRFSAVFAFEADDCGRMVG